MVSPAPTAPDPSTGPPPSLDSMRTKPLASRRFAAAALPVIATTVAAAIVPSAAAATDEWLVSTGADVGFLSPDLPAFEDGDVFFVREGAPPRAFVQRDHWRGLGDLEPGDVDAVGFDPTAGPPARSLRFSMLSNEGGFLDGDVLGLAPGGGVQVVVAEAELEVALGVQDAGLDVDALDVDEEGRLVFSLQNDLSATTLGPISNGDVLRLDAPGQVVRLATEADVEAALAQATGQSATVGDVHGVAILGGTLHVAVQSPSAFDGGVIRLGASPAVVADEVLLGLGGLELDALAAAPAGHRALGAWFEPSGVAGSGRVVIEGQPNELVAIVPAGGVGWLDASYFPGFGAWYVDPSDPALLAQLASGALAVATLDAFGRTEFQIGLPGVGAASGFDGTPGWTFQFLSLSSAELSAPLRIDV